MMAKRSRSMPNDDSSARDWRRAVLAAMLLAFVAVTSLSDGKLIPDFITGGRPIVAISEPHGDDLRTGSILITPRDGNICELRLIDNETWRIHSAGRIECDEAVAWNSQRGDVYTPQSRIEAVRDGFVSRR
jgi:hypothetical protein